MERLQHVAMATPAFAVRAFLRCIQNVLDNADVMP